MARYILIDSQSGYIWGDSSDLDGGIFVGTPIEYATALNLSLGNHERNTYSMQNSNPHDTSGGYLAYRADINGSEVVPVVTDGQDQDTIDAVTEKCEYLGFITYSDNS